MGYEGEAFHVAVKEVAPAAPAAPAASAPDFYSHYMEKFVKPVLEKGDALGDQFKSLVLTVLLSVRCRMRSLTLCL